MKITEIINEEATYDRFDADSKFNQRPTHDLLPGDHDPFDFTGLKKYSRTGGNATGDEFSPIKSTRQRNDEKYRRKVLDFFKKFDNAVDATGRIGYSRTHDAGNHMGYLTTKNNIKLGLNVNYNGNTKYIVTLIPKGEALAAINDALKQNRFTTKITGKGGIDIQPSTSNLDKQIEEILKIADIIEELGPDLKQYSGSGRGAGSVLKGKMAPWNYYKHLAKMIHSAVENNISWGFSRGGENSAYDRYDSHIVIGITEAGYKQALSGKNPYREHVVPSDYINTLARDYCLEHIDDENQDAVILEVAKIIHRNLAVVWCSTEEAKILDKDKGFQTTMPKDWKDGMSILARFTDGEPRIKVYKYVPGDPDHGKHLTEDE
jgi:hypothetical protein